MKNRYLVSFVAAALCAAPVWSSDLVNRDDKEYTVRVEDENGERTITVKAGETVAGICNACVLYLEDDDEGYDVFEDEVVFILDGKLTMKGSEPEPA